MNTEPNKTEKKTGKFSAFFASFPRKLPSFILKNWSWKLLSLFLAVCLWAGLITQDPTLTRERIFSDVKLNIINADTLRRNSGLVVISGLEDENLHVRMRVDVPQREYNTVTLTNYNPRVDLSRITDVGEQTVRISSTSTTSYGIVKDITPDTVTVVVDEYVTNYRIPVSVNVTGEYPEGFYGSAISIDPSVVAVSGPKTYVDQVERIMVDFDVSRLSAREGTVRTARTMRFLDENGNDVDSSMLEVTSADVVLRTIILTQTLYSTREFPLDTETLIKGSPAEGYRIKEVTVSPASLMAAGTTEALDSVEMLYASSAVDVTGAENSFTQTVRVRKPGELAYVSNETVTVSVEIEPSIISRTFENARLQILGTGSGLKASVDKRNVSMVLTGPELLVESLRSSNVMACVNTDGLGAGEHTLPVELYVEGVDLTDVTCIATPATVTVTLSEKN